MNRLRQSFGQVFRGQAMNGLHCQQSTWLRKSTLANPQGGIESSTYSDYPNFPPLRPFYGWTVEHNLSRDPIVRPDME